MLTILNTPPNEEIWVETVGDAFALGIELYGIRTKRPPNKEMLIAGCINIALQQCSYGLFCADVQDIPHHFEHRFTLSGWEREKEFADLVLYRLGPASMNEIDYGSSQMALRFSIINREDELCKYEAINEGDYTKFFLVTKYDLGRFLESEYQVQMNPWKMFPGETKLRVLRMLEDPIPGTSVREIEEYARLDNTVSMPK